MIAFATKQRPKPEEGATKVSVSWHNKELVLFTEKESIFLRLEQPEVIFVNQVGMMVKGYEPTGFDRHGTPTNRYMEVFLSWIDPATQKSFFDKISTMEQLLFEGEKMPPEHAIAETVFVRDRLSTNRKVPSQLGGLDWEGEKNGKK